MQTLFLSIILFFYICSSEIAQEFWKRSNGRVKNRGCTSIAEFGSAQPRSTYWFRCFRQRLSVFWSSLASLEIRLVSHHICNTIIVHYIASIDIKRHVIGIFQSDFDQFYYIFKHFNLPVNLILYVAILSD